MTSPRDDLVDAERVAVLLRLVEVVSRALSGLDPYMVGHVDRVAKSCERLAGAMGLSPRERFLLDLTARFHDVGMLATPAYILRKPSALAESEMEEVRVHPVRGAELFGADPALAVVARAIRHHHERVDGTGYPDGLAGEAIPLFSRMILVAEAYDAMTHHRPYRRAMGHAEALERLREGGGAQFDPAVVAHFIATLPAPAAP